SRRRGTNREYVPCIHRASSWRQGDLSPPMHMLYPDSRPPCAMSMSTFYMVHLTARITLIVVVNVIGVLSLRPARLPLNRRQGCGRSGPVRPNLMTVRWAECLY
ncbi:hypothetical protein BDFG_02061, partial [Blastomyces dermatitidis ATCC 26199]